MDRPEEVFLVVEWIDGIPETVRVYYSEDAAEQACDVLGRTHMGVIRMEVSDG